MAASTHMFTDKETNNWFKACLALNLTKEGLANFLKTELQKLQTAVGISCGNCSTQKLVLCPTNPYCSKRKRNYCPYHKSQIPQSCLTCDKVKQNIESHHRYNNPSWRNTDATKWASDYWEIGKCFLPPDGYSSVLSVQESDLNGVISILLNCTHFQNCLSPSCLSPPPPNKQSPLEMVRQIGRDVRHTSDCKVTDSALHGYFQRLSTLLADPKFLLHDHSATIARTRLSDLQNDRMSLKDLGELLKEAYQTLEHAKETGERVSKEAERTLAEALKKIDTSIQAGEQRIECKTQLGEQRIDSTTQLGEQRIESKTQLGEQRIESKTQLGEQRIDSTTQLGEQRIESKTLAVEKRIETKGNDVKQNIERQIKDGTHHISRHLQIGIVRMQLAANKTKAEDYERCVADLRQCLIQYYDDTTCNVPVLTFDNSLDKRITDVYATPKIHRINIEKDGQRVKEERILAYRDIFYTNNTSNKRIYIQGEPGRGKSTFAVKLVHDWCYEKPPLSAITSENISLSNRLIWRDENLLSPSAPINIQAFEDRVTLQKFKFLFFITLRDSRDQTDVTQMIKKQLIDNMFSDEERADKYKLLLQIIKTEICLVVREGLDEWVCPSGSNLAEPSMAGFPKDTCTVLTTTRPWKLVDEKIKNSQIERLLEIEGIISPYSFTKNILRCIIDQRKALGDTVDEFELFVNRRELQSLSSSPMLYALVICNWVDTIGEEEHLKGSSLCLLYTTLLESLCKKANSAPGYFNDSNAPPVHCFSRTNYLQPNIEHLNKLACAACKLLFSCERETAIVFNDIKLSHYFSNEEFVGCKMFALKAGILTNRKEKHRTENSNLFIHKSVQEFLAAYHIACNPNVIDDIISRYLECYNNSYLDISQVLIFVCGMNISAANKLSALMNQCDVDNCGASGYYACAFQRVIESGIREAVANKQDGIRLKLSHFNITPGNMRDINLIWSTNTSNIHSFSGVFNALDERTSHFEVKLSSCLKLKWLQLWGNGIWFQETDTSSKSEHPIMIVLNSACQFQCAGPLPVLPSIERIYLQHVICSSTWLHGLFCTLLTCDHEVVCTMRQCYINSHSDYESSKIHLGKHAVNMHISTYESPGLREALHGLKIKSLTLSGFTERLCVKSYAQSLSSLKQLGTLSIDMNNSPSLWEALNGLNIKSLTVIGRNKRLDVKFIELLKQSLSSLKQMETLSIDMNNSPSLWEAIKRLNIKSLTLTGWNERLDVEFVESFRQSLYSLKQLESLSIDMYNSSGIWKALNGLNIKNMTLNGFNKLYDVNHVESLSQTPSSLKQLETLTICVFNYIDLQLPQSLKYVNIYCYALYPSELRTLAKTLSACDQKIEGKLEFGCSRITSGYVFSHIFERIPVEEYMAIRQELVALKNVAVKRFKIFDRIKPNMRTGDADSAWSVRGICDSDDDHEDYGNVEDDAHKKFIANINDIIINRISMRFAITPDSIS
ncbi:uncharacterized protein LOC127833603 [Dreissena polymorpha]|uniref:NACHT domain-containing protein n=1 Tax=Dreissena polymorpha TaxID=45954 RepID=A0A9D4JGC6_DREPO|nr:uncharacterized protein LOC127833603 [Dreissena polymorpha]KAH3811686.1 hypothetical protein DPMN_140098 [Dreissena polymorpha]